MNNRVYLLKLLFSKVSWKDILGISYNHSSNRFNAIDRSWFLTAFNYEFNTGYTHEEVELLWEKANDWMTINNRKNIFNLLAYCSNEMLAFNDNEVLCRFNQFQHWHEVTKVLDEDLLVACYLASRQQGAPFSTWKSFIRTDNEQLEQIIDLGLTDLHFHTYGSSQSFMLNWISLMNNVLNLNEKCEEIDKVFYKTPRTIYKYEISHPSTGTEALVAAWLRLILFYSCDLPVAQVLQLPIYKEAIEQNIIFYLRSTTKLQQAISTERQDGKKFNYSPSITAELNAMGITSKKKQTLFCLDYAVRDGEAQGADEELLCFGEKRIYSKCLQKIFSDQSTDEEINHLS